MNNLRSLIGISVFWLGLSMLSDGVNILVLPAMLLSLAGEANRATTLGLLTFIGLLIAMLVQPVAGAVSDILRPRWGRRGSLVVGTLFTLLALAAFSGARYLVWVVIGYLLLQITSSATQAAQQGLLPDLIPARLRGTAAGLKSLADVGGAMLGFVLLGQLLGEGQANLALLLIGVVLVGLLLLTLILVRERSPVIVNVVPVTGRKPGPWLLSSAFRLDAARQRSFLWLVVARFLFLLGTYGIGRFLLLFVADRLGLGPDEAAEQAGNLLAGLALITVLASLPGGWAADRFGRMTVMAAGAVVSAVGALLLVFTRSSTDILLFGGLLSIGSAAFSAANWAMTADLAPVSEAGRYLGLANFGTAGAAAAAGLFGPLVDAVNTLTPGAGYSALFAAAALAFLISVLALRFVRTRPTPVEVSGIDRELR